MGFDAMRWLWRYFLLGAVIVMPIWLIVRLVSAPRGSSGVVSRRRSVRACAATRDREMSMREPRLCGA